jgi:hypothetical protein
MELDSSFYEEEDYLLLNLKRFLNYHISTALLYFLSFFTIIFLFIAAFFALVFSVYLYYVLIKIKKYGWISFFSLIIFIPSILLILFVSKSEYLITFLLIELGIFYFFCFIFRFVVNDWCEELSWKILRLKEKKEKEDLENLALKKPNENS